MIDIVRGLSLAVAVLLLPPAPVDELADLEPVLHLKALSSALLASIFFLLEHRPMLGRIKNALVAGVGFFAMSTLLRLLYYFYLSGLPTP